MHKRSHTHTHTYAYVYKYSNRKQTVIQQNVVYDFIRCIGLTAAAAVMRNGLFTILLLIYFLVLKVVLGAFNFFHIFE